MTTNLPATVPDGEWTTRRADQLHVGDHIAGDMLPLGQHGEVIFTRFFERNRSEWMFVAFVQWDGFHDSTTFLASAPIRVRTAQPQQVADPTGLAYTRADDEADDPTPVSGRRVEPHTGAMTDEGLVDETPPEPVTVYFSFGHGQTDPDSGENLLDHYVTVVGPSHEACRKAILASRFGYHWAFDYLKGNPESDEWIARWTEHERIDATGTAD